MAPSTRLPFPTASCHRHRASGSAPVTALAALVTAVLALEPPPAGAARREPQAEAAVGPPAVTRVAHAASRRALEASPAWRGFVSRHGPWVAMWNEVTRSPHRAFGPPIRLAGRLDRPAAAEAAVRAFVAGEPELFGAPVLEGVRVQRVRDLWYVSLRQTAGGLPVLMADWEFRVSSRGDLVAFGADAHRPPPQAGSGARLPASVARVAALARMPFDPARDRVEGGERAALLPMAGEDGPQYRAVLETRIVTAEPPGDWTAFVDATTGEVLWRWNRVRYAIGGTVTGGIHPALPTNPLSPQPFRNLWVNVGANTVVTDPAGTYSAPATGTVTVSAQLRGPYCDVNRQDGVADASFSTSASDPATVHIDWAGAHDAERDGFYHTNLVHDYLRALDPGLTALDYVMPCAVNINNTCNAFWNGTGINFYRAGGGCPNTATMPDVVYHEYGHGVNDKLYVQLGSPSGMINGALHEGMADVLAAFVQDSPLIGKGFFGPGTSLRTIDNTRRWPQDGSGGPHNTGLIIGGAFWDLREAVGLAVAADLSHFAKYGRPDDPDAGVAMNEYFVETLVADDTDGNINNGTPHFNEILAAFNAHGIGTTLFMELSHTPLDDQPDAGPYPVTALASWNPRPPAGFGGLAGPPSLRYAVNGGPFQTVAMAPTGNLGEYAATIPGQSAAVVSYYLSLTDTYGETISSPVEAPSNVHRFLAGPATVLLDHHQEADHGWVAGAPGDDATTGHWIHDNPIGTSVNPPLEVQPEDDHTPWGSLCWVTGNAQVGLPAGTNDVDGGRTTVTTALFDATASGLVHPVISYYRWYTNNQGASPGLDVWRADISNDAGLTWVPVENTTRSSNAWERVLFSVSDFVTPTPQMLMRFIAEDADPGSLVEAAVDDFQLLAFSPTVAVEGSPPPGAVTLAVASRHPAKGPVRLHYALPAAGPATLAVYDLGGRLVGTLASGWHAAGVHVAEWNGRDEGGVELASGVYFARLSAAGRLVSRTLVRMR